jgi:hypothetical protein
MDEFLKAFRAFREGLKDPDDYYMEVENKEILSLCREPKENTIKISKKDFMLLLDTGIKHFFYDGNIVRKPFEIKTKHFSVLKESDEGYRLLDNDPYWPEEIVKGGYKWDQQ